MKRIIRPLLSVILFCGYGMLLTSCSESDNPIPSKPDTPTAEVDYTVMLYSTGGEDLDISTEEDFIEACKGLLGNESRVRFFVQYKCSPQKDLDKQAEEYKNENSGKDYGWITGKSGALYRVELTSSMCKGDRIKPFTDSDLWGTQQQKAQMYQPDSIANFIRYCSKVAPAKNYVFIVSDHGSGYNVLYDFKKNYMSQVRLPIHRAVCADPFNNDYCITIKELREGIEKSGVHLNLLDFDDCLMNCAEVVSEFTDVCDYMLAANHTTIGGGYIKFINHLAKAAATGDFVGEMKVYQDEFADKYRDIKEDSTVQKKYPGALKHCAYALTDMTKFKAVLPAVKAFTDKLISEAQAGTLTALQQKTAASKCYQPQAGYPYYDLIGYAYHLQTLDANLTPEYEAMKQAVSDALLKQAYTPVLAQYLSTADFKQLTYNVNLGATVTDEENAARKGTILRVLPANGFKLVTCLDENGYFWTFDADDYTFLFGEDDALPQSAWPNSYELSTFVQQTGWDKWIRQNVGFPTKNPPYYFE